MNTLDALIKKWENNEFCMDDRLDQIFIDNLVKYLVYDKARTKELFEWADKNNANIIKNDSFYELSFNGMNRPIAWALTFREALEKAKYIYEIHEALD